MCYVVKRINLFVEALCIVASTGILSNFFVSNAHALSLEQRDAVLQQQASTHQARTEREQTVSDQPSRLFNDWADVPGYVVRPGYVSDEKPCFVIRKVHLDGRQADQFATSLARIISGKDSAHGLASPIGRCLGAQSVQALATRLQDLIIEQGYVTTRVLVTPQDISSGKLTLTVLPGIVSAIRRSNASDIRAHFWNAIPITEGAILNLRDLEQGLENLRRLPTVQADIDIGPGRLPGQSELLINWNQSRPLRAFASVDDAGNKATGKYQTALTVAADHIFTLNDIFYVSHSRTLGNTKNHRRRSGSTAFHYSIPWGYWQLAFNTNQFSYRQLVAGSIRPYVYSGDSRTTDLTLSRVIWRDSRRKTQAYFKGWERRSSNHLDGTEIEVQRRRTAGWELGLTHREYLSRATLDVALAYRRGTGARGAMPAPEASLGEGASRSRLVTGSLSLAVPFHIGQQAFRYHGTVRAQWNGTRLVALDQFAIGGRYSVRGFDGEQVLMGDRGWFWRNEWVMPLQARGLPGHELYLGMDVGKVGGPASRYLAGNTLAGAVLGIRGQLGNYVNYELFAGRPLHKPANVKTARIASGFSVSIAY